MNLKIETVDQNGKYRAGMYDNFELQLNGSLKVGNWITTTRSVFSVH